MQIPSFSIQNPSFSMQIRTTSTYAAGTARHSPSRRPTVLDRHSQIVQRVRCNQREICQSPAWICKAEREIYQSPAWIYKAGREIYQSPAWIYTASTRTEKRRRGLRRHLLLEAVAAFFGVSRVLPEQIIDRALVEPAAHHCDHRIDQDGEVCFCITMKVLD